MELFISLFNVIIQILVIAIFLRVILSWIRIDPSSPMVNVLNEVTEPILSPIRKILPMTGPIDFSPLIAMIILTLIQAIVNSLL